MHEIFILAVFVQAKSARGSYVRHKPFYRYVDAKHKILYR